MPRSSSLAPVPPEEPQPTDPSERVQQTLRFFRAICKQLTLRADPCIAARAPIRRVDLTAVKILKSNGRWPHEAPLHGHVPGVEIGCKFIYRIELALVRLHRPPENGIDYDSTSGLATSIVASAGYPDSWSLSDGVLIYSGMGGCSRRRNSDAKDQKMEGGNLALTRSMAARMPVRVIYGFREINKRMATSFFYDGLYLVEDWRKVVGKNDCFIFEFRLRRKEGQPHCPEWESVFKKMVLMSKNRGRPSSSSEGFSGKHK